MFRTNRMNDEEHIKQLLLKFSLNRCTPEEKMEVLQYFRENPNVEVMPEMRKNLESKTDELPEEAEVIYAKILAKIQKEQRPLVAIKRKRSIFYLTAVAAVFIAVLGVTFYFQMINSRIHTNQNQDLVVANDAIVLELGDGNTEVLSDSGNLKIADKEGRFLGGQKGNKLIYQKQESVNNEITYNTLSVPYGKTFEIQLSDGSTVHMNAGSTLKYPVRFPTKGNRQVYLTGEAFFKVAKDEQQRFIVEAGNLQIAVLGTEFNVSAYPEDHAKNVVLVEGSVSMGSIEDTGKSVVLKPGQLGSLDHVTTTIKIQEVDTKIYTSWLDGELVFKDLPFESILMKMERHYNVKIINKNSIMAGVMFNAHFKNEEIVDILNYFKQVYGLSFEVGVNNEFIINP
ncbi:MAG: FecR family protein [Prolixibacteraceae bacterium]